MTQEERAMIEGQLAQDQRINDLNNNMAIQAEQERLLASQPQFGRNQGLGNISPEIMAGQQSNANSAMLENARAGQIAGGRGLGGQGLGNAANGSSYANKTSDAILMEMARDAAMKQASQQQGSGLGNFGRQ